MINLFWPRTCLPVDREPSEARKSLNLEDMGHFVVYALRSVKNGRIYVGFTENLERRLEEHNSGKTRSTKAWRPWELHYSEVKSTRLEARNREKYLKSGIGKEYLKSL